MRLTDRMDEPTILIGDSMVTASGMYELSSESSGSIWSDFNPYSDMYNMHY